MDAITHLSGGSGQVKVKLLPMFNWRYLHYPGIADLYKKVAPKDDPGCMLETQAGLFARPAFATSTVGEQRPRRFRVFGYRVQGIGN